MSAKDEGLASAFPPSYLPPEDEPVLLPKKKKKPTKAERKAKKLAEAIEFKKLETRDHLRRELELSQRSAQKGQDIWEEWCQEIKITELRTEVEVWGKRAKDIMTKKDEKIQTLLEDMATTEEMHKRHFEKQLHVMNYLIDTYKTLLESTKLIYETQASELIQDFHEELNVKANIDDDRQLNFENIMHARNMTIEQTLLTDYEIYEERKNDRVNCEIVKRYCLRDSITEKMKALRKQLLVFVESLSSSTLDVHKFEKFNSLMERQRIYVFEAEKLNDQEVICRRRKEYFKRSLLRKEIEGSRELNDLRLERQYFIQVRKNIEKNIELDREITLDKLTVLGTESYNLIKDFQKMVKYGELLLSLTANCRKLQTESEKVVPWGEFPEPKDAKEEEQLEEYFKMVTLDLAKHTDLTEEEIVNTMNTMKNFWRRQALVEMQNLLLREEKRALIAENEKFVNFIKSMSKTDDEDELLQTLSVECIQPNDYFSCPQYHFKKIRQ